jgi:hypothetical protein
MIVYGLPNELITQMQERSKFIWDKWAKDVGAEGNAFMKSYFRYAE